MSCPLCQDLVDIADLSRIYTVKTCDCGRRIQQRNSGAHGVGLRIEKGDQVILPPGALRLAANPLKGAGQFSRTGIAWFAELVFKTDLASPDGRETFTESLQQLIEQDEQLLRSSDTLKGIDLDSPSAGETIFEILQKNKKSVEWWAYTAASFFSVAADAISKGDARQAAWAMACGERVRSLAIFREHFEEVVFMGNSARRLIDLLALWNNNRENSDEEFWQTTIAANSFALGQLFSAPVALLKDKAYVGGQTLERTDARLLDFLLSGTVSNNAVLVEIKTPTTRLLGAQYRTNAFSPSSDLTGSVVQVNDYAHLFKENIASLTKDLGTPLKAIDPKCVVLIGNHGVELKDAKQRASFELFRSALRGIEIVTFDEFFRKISALANLFGFKESAGAAGDRS